MSKSSRKCHKFATGNDHAASEVVGSILMVGIAVSVMAVLSMVVLNIPPPDDTIHVDVRIDLLPGADGWGTGDEKLRIQHIGGEPIPLTGTVIQLQFGALTETYDDTIIGAPFTDGFMTLGERWISTRTVNEEDKYDVQMVVVGTRASRILAHGSVSAALVGGAGGGGGMCSVDTAPPTASFIQAPVNVDTVTLGAVSVTATLLDNCSGIAGAPTLFYRLQDGTNPPWIDGGLMTLQSGTSYSGVIPDQTWASQLGKTLEYYAGNMMDTVGNTADSQVIQDPIEAGAGCSLDSTPPSVGTWTVNPNDVSTDTTSAISVRVQVVDDCIGVDLNRNPSLSFRVNDGTNPAYTPLGAMTNLGGGVWSGAIPADTWGNYVGQTLEMQVSDMYDLNGNIGTSSRADVIQQNLVYTYVNSNTPTFGTVTNFAAMQSGTDGGAYGIVSERSVPAGGSVTTILDANSVVQTGGWTNPSFAYTSNDLRAADTGGNGNIIEYGIADMAGSSTITSVILKFEGYATRANGNWRLHACTTVGCIAPSALLGIPLIDTVLQYDVTNLRPGGGAWTVADINSLVMTIDPEKDGGGPNPDWLVDHAFVEVVSQQATYDLNVEFAWTGVPDTATEQLEIRYLASGDTFNVQVWNGLTWQTRGVPLDATSLTTWTYTLTASEYNFGAPRIRIVDATPSGTTQGNILIDYARVLSQ